MLIVAGCLLPWCRSQRCSLACDRFVLYRWSNIACRWYAGKHALSVIPAFMLFYFARFHVLGAEEERGERDREIQRVRVRETERVQGRVRHRDRESTWKSLLSIGSEMDVAFKTHSRSDDVIHYIVPYWETLEGDTLCSLGQCYIKPINFDTAGHRRNYSWDRSKAKTPRAVGLLKAKI